MISPVWTMAIEDDFIKHAHLGNFGDWSNAMSTNVLNKIMGRTIINYEAKSKTYKKKKELFLYSRF